MRKTPISRLCLDATGQYHLDLALDAAGLAVVVINPKAAKRFAEAIQTRTKTDAVDAAVLLSLPCGYPSFTPWQRPDAQALATFAPVRATSQR